MDFAAQTAVGFIMGQLALQMCQHHCDKDVSALLQFGLAVAIIVQLNDNGPIHHPAVQIGER